MKEYKLLSWPEHSSEFQRTVYRRVLTEMSSRFMSVAQLAEASGLKKNEVRHFVEKLDDRGLVEDRDATAPDSFFDSISPLGWLRRRSRAVTQTRR